MTMKEAEGPKREETRKRSFPGGGPLGTLIGATTSHAVRMLSVEFNINRPQEPSSSTLKASPN